MIRNSCKPMKKKKKKKHTHLFHLNVHAKCQPNVKNDSNLLDNCFITMLAL